MTESSSPRGAPLASPDASIIARRARWREMTARQKNHVTSGMYIDTILFRIDSGHDPERGRAVL
jgi:hypothetical protein